MFAQHWKYKIHPLCFGNILFHDSFFSFSDSSIWPISYQISMHYLIISMKSLSCLLNVCRFKIRDEIALF